MPRAAATTSAWRKSAAPHQTFVSGKPHHLPLRGIGELPTPLALGHQASLGAASLVAPIRAADAQDRATKGDSRFAESARESLTHKIERLTALRIGLASACFSAEGFPRVGRVQGARRTARLRGGTAPSRQRQRGGAAGADAAQLAGRGLLGFDAVDGGGEEDRGAGGAGGARVRAPFTAVDYEATPSRSALVQVLAPVYGGGLPRHQATACNAHSAGGAADGGRPPAGQPRRAASAGGGDGDRLGRRREHRLVGRPDERSRQEAALAEPRAMAGARDVVASRRERQRPTVPGVLDVRVSIQLELDMK
mmetsp:Transcript_27151/g.87157  ORF Transcript_27151/g.87157 Transcript_27151/m.87157 type:complete len:308 (+) Transcript_27151:837-1760(+)